MSVDNRTTRNPWPLFLVAIGIAFIVLTCWSIERAATRGSAVVDRDYYMHGLQYGQTVQESGWRIATTVSGRALRAAVTDFAHRPVVGCRGDLRLVAAGVVLPLRETGTGTYEVELPARDSDTAALLTLRQGEVRLERQLLITAGG